MRLTCPIEIQQSIAEVGNLRRRPLEKLFCCVVAASLPREAELSAAAPSLTTQDIFHFNSYFCCFSRGVILTEQELNLS